MQLNIIIIHSVAYYYNEYSQLVLSETGDSAKHKRSGKCLRNCEHLLAGSNMLCHMHSNKHGCLT